MKSIQNDSKIIGLFFLIAMATSLIGGGAFIEPVLSRSDFLASALIQKNLLMVGLLLELVNALCVFGIGTFMIPILRPHSEKMAYGYFGMRIMEAVFCSLMIVGPLSVLLLSQQNTGYSSDSINAIGHLAMINRTTISGLLVPIFFVLGAQIFYTALLQTKLLPKLICIWGLIGAILILILNIANHFIIIDDSIGIVFALPIILNEIVMGVWLIAKGFNRIDPAFNQDIS